MGQPVYLVNGKRTPQAKAGAELSAIAAPYLGHYLIAHLCDVHGVNKNEVDEVIVGNTGILQNILTLGGSLHLRQVCIKRRAATQCTAIVPLAW